VFLSGEREIRETAESLRKHHPQGCEVLPLYSRLSQDEQQRVFRHSGRRRIVLATNVAETSLTVPGIRSVIDTGVARISRYSHRSRLQRLPIEKISQASANQRSGRCGRVGPGIAIRLYSEEDFAGRPAFTEPEIQRTNLAAVILQMHALRSATSRPSRSSSRPTGATCATASARCASSARSARTASSSPRPGRRLSRLPLDPRLGRILLAGATSSAWKRWRSSRRRCRCPTRATGPPTSRRRPTRSTRRTDEQSDFLSLLKLWRAVEAAAQGAVAREAARLVQASTSCRTCGSPSGRTCTGR
jgi:ATP-dependent helicase HrpA